MKQLLPWAFTVLLVSLLFLPMRVATAQLIATLEGHTEVVWSVAFSPDGKTLASGSWDQTVRLWDVETEQLLHILTGHTGEVNSVAFSLDGGTLASGSWDGTIRLWESHTGGHKKTLIDHNGGIGTIAFSPDGKMLASASADQTVRLWNTTTWQTEKILRGHSHVVDWVAFSPDSTIVASGGRDLTVRLWNVETEQQIRTLTGHAHGIRGIVFSPDGNTLVTGDHEGTVLLWQPHTGQLKRTLLEKTGLIRPVAFSPDDGTLAIGGQGISLWDTDTEEYKRPLGGIGIVSSLTFSPDGQIIASGGAHNLVRLLESTPPEVPFATVPFDINNIPEPVPPPETVRDFFELDLFYQQWINVGGLPVLASAEVNPYAVKEAAWIIYQMIGHRGDILEALAHVRQRVSVTSINESLGDLPESERMNSRLLFLYAHTSDRVCCGITLADEVRLLDSGSRSPPIIHEFAHTIHHGLNQIGPEFDNRLRATYEAAMEKGLYSGYFASSIKDEYWAEGAQSWFNATQSNAVNTRSALKTYDPGLAKLLTEVFSDRSWRYTPPDTRLHLPHLQELTPQDFPRYGESPPWEIRSLELEEQLKNPNSDGDGKWVDLKLYHPSLLPSLIESTTRGEDTAFIWVNLTGGEISFYYVDADGAERWVYTAATKPFYDANTHVGAVWLIKDHKGEDLAVFRAEGKLGRVLVTPAPTLITPGLSKISGDNHSSVPGEVIANPLVIEVRDENLSVLEGISVTFTVTAGDGTLSATHATTDEKGRAESTLTLGQNVGTTTVSVSAVGIEGTVTFNAVVEAAADIPDANLRAAIEAALGKAPGGSITGADMAMLPKLDARNAGINDLTGLEHATNLKSLWLDGEDVQGTWRNSNSVSNLSPLAGLTNLTELELKDNNISDISPLAGLTNLTRLGLRENTISDISALGGLTNLTWLNLWENNIKDISALQGLTNLTELQLGGNKMTDISPVAGFINLETLLLKGNNISDISALGGLTNLTRLGLAHNNISDLSPLARLTNLATLGLHGNRISDLSPLAGLTNLAKVVLRRNPLSYQSIHTHIPDLQSRGVTVEFEDRTHPALLKISGDNQKGASFVPLSEPFVVEAQDANGSPLAGISVTFAVTGGGGTLNTTITRTNTNGRAQSTLTLGPNLGTNTVQVSAAGIQGKAIFNAISDSESPPLTADVNNDGSVNVLDLIVVASALGNTGTNLTVDVNRDGVISILDLILVAGMFDSAAAAPSVQPQVPETLTAVEVQGWLTDARSLGTEDPIMKRGFVVLEQLLISLTPKETELLANYPNPFNPETWIPYRLAEDVFVTLTIYDGAGQIVRTLDVGHRIAAVYESRSKAIYWDGKNEIGEQVANGVYFYTLSAGDYSATQKMVVLK